MISFTLGVLVAQLIENKNLNIMILSSSCEIIVLHDQNFDSLMPSKSGRMKQVLLLLLYLIRYSHSQLKDCFYFDGSSAQDYPCDPEAKVSPLFCTPSSIIIICTRSQRHTGQLMLWSQGQVSNKFILHRSSRRVSSRKLHRSIFSRRWMPMAIESFSSSFSLGCCFLVMRTNHLGIL